MGRPLDKNLVDRFLGAAHQSGRIERGRAARIIGNVYGRMAGNLNPPTKKLEEDKQEKILRGELDPHYLRGYIAGL